MGFVANECPAFDGYGHLISNWQFYHLDELVLNNGALKNEQ